MDKSDTGTGFKYDMRPEKRQVRRRIFYQRDITYIPLDGVPRSFPCRLAEFRDERYPVDSSGNPVSDAEKIVETGIAAIDAINEAKGLNRISRSVPAPGMYKDTARAVLLTKESLDKISVSGMNPFDVIRDEEIKDGIFQKLAEAHARDEDDEPDPQDDYRLVLWNHGSGKLMDLHSEFIPTAIHLGYINGSVDNTQFDLASLLDHLRHSPWIRGNLEITEIPSYNQAYGRTKTIEFVVMLPADIFNEIIRRQGSLNDLYTTVLSYISADKYRMKQKLETE